MATIDALKDLYSQYKEDLAAAEAERNTGSVFASIFTGKHETEAVHASFLKKAVALMGNPPEENLDDVLAYMVRQSAEMKGSAEGLSYVALLGTLKPHMGAVSPAAAAEAVSLLEKSFSRRERLPVMDEIISALKKRTE